MISDDHDTHDGQRTISATSTGDPTSTRPQGREPPPKPVPNRRRRTRPAPVSPSRRSRRSGGAKRSPTYGRMSAASGSAADVGSLERQLRICRTEARRRRFEVVETYLDEGVPGVGSERRQILHRPFAGA